MIDIRYVAGKAPNELAQMFHGTDSDFLGSMCRAVFEWEGLGRSDVLRFRIHRKSDRVIPPPRHADLLVDGGHLISMTHAPACVELILRHHAPS